MDTATHTNPEDTYDLILDKADCVHMYIEKKHPEFADATLDDDGEKIFFEIREDESDSNQYWIALPMDNITQCVRLMNYIPLLVNELKSLHIKALQGFAVLYLKADETGDKYSEEVFCEYDFKEENL